MSNIVYQNIHSFFKQLLYHQPLEGEICSELLKEELLSNKPSMIARFGSTEIKAILYPKMPWVFRVFFRKRFFTNMDILSGFFPSNEENIRRFSTLMYNDIKELDILGSWRMEERFLEKQYPKAKRIQLSALEPYLSKNPWSEVLVDKKVLVIHPFNKTIENQYEINREYLFQDKRVLPKFKSLETIKAVQTIAGNRAGFADWFEALEYMKDEIDKRDFDIAIIGCGAYGFPLAAHVKRIGKKAVHLGGPTQLLFGIKGKRWLENEKFDSIINEYFVFPSNEDLPTNAHKVEGGCYW